MYGYGCVKNITIHYRYRLLSLLKVTVLRLLSPLTCVESGHLSHYQLRLEHYVNTSLRLSAHWRAARVVLQPRTRTPLTHCLSTASLLLLLPLLRIIHCNQNKVITLAESATLRHCLSQLSSPRLYFHPWLDKLLVAVLLLFYGILYNWKIKYCFYCKNFKVEWYFC